jgi:argininosuccinate synthase
VKAIAFAEENAIPINVTKRSPFSIDQNVWDARWKPDSWNTSGMRQPRTSTTTRGPHRQLELSRRGRHRILQGVPVSIDGRSTSVLEAIVELNRRAGAQGVGRLDVVETGWSASRVARSTRRRGPWRSSPRTPSSSTSRAGASWAVQADHRPAVGELVYDGLWYSPLKTALETFVDHTQEHVTGEIRMVLHGGHIAVNGRRSAESLYDFNLATYDEGDTFDQSSAKVSCTCTGCASPTARGRPGQLLPRAVANS